MFCKSEDESIVKDDEGENYIEALQYDIDEATYDMIYEYMVERYHDLARDEACISGKYKERAQEIWDELNHSMS